MILAMKHCTPQLNHSAPTGKTLRHFKFVTYCKMEMFVYVLTAGYNVFWMDADAILLKDPLKFLPLSHQWEGACRSKHQRNTGSAQQLLGQGREERVVQGNTVSGWCMHGPGKHRKRR